MFNGVQHIGFIEAAFCAQINDITGDGEVRGAAQRIVRLLDVLAQRGQQVQGEFVVGAFLLYVGVGDAGFLAQATVDFLGQYGRGLRPVGDSQIAEKVAHRLFVKGGVVRHLTARIERLADKAGNTVD